MKKLFLIFILIVSKNILYADYVYDVEKIFQLPKLSFAQSLSCIDKDNFILLRTDIHGNGYIVDKTTDGGFSWKTILSDTTFYIMTDSSYDSIYVPRVLAYHCFYYPDGKLIITTREGKIFISDDFGDNFIESNIENFLENSFVMLNKNQAVATSDAWAYFPGTIYALLKSNDGCKTWNFFNVPDEISKRWTYSTIDIQNDSSLIIGLSPRYGVVVDTKKSYFVHTNFEGDFWNIIETPNLIRSIYYFNDTIAIASGYKKNNSNTADSTMIFKTYDGGKNWILKAKFSEPHNSMTNFYKYSDSLIFYSGFGLGFVMSNDMGESWILPKYNLNPKPDLYTDVIVSRFTSSLKYFDNDSFYFITSFPEQLIKGTKVSTSVILPSIKAKNIYPNPISSFSTFTAEYEIEKSGNIKIYLSDINGKKISELYNGFIDIGLHSISMQLSDKISSGTYWLIAEINGYCHFQILNIIN